MLHNLPMGQVIRGQKSAARVGLTDVACVSHDSYLNVSREEVEVDE